MRRVLLVLGLGVLTGCGGQRVLAPPAGVSASSATSAPAPVSQTPPASIAQSAVSALPPPPPGRVAIAFPDAQDGWVAGAGLILHTADAGHTWTVQHRGSEIFLGLDFPTHKEGWAWTATVLLHTLDGGATWSSVPPPDVSPAVSADFLPSGEGWVATGGGALWDYSRQPDLEMMRPLKLPGPASAVHLIDAEHGWGAGAGRVYATTDGGAVWTQQLDATPGTFPEFADGGAWLSFPTPTTGWALFDAGSGHASQKSYALYRTADGGSHWDQVLANRFFSTNDQGSAPIGPGGYPMALAAPDAADAYLAVFSPAGAWVEVTATHNGGQTWSALAMDTRPAVHGNFTDAGLAFTDAQHGWLATLAGGQLTLWSTQDAGLTWSRQYAIGG